MLTQVLFQSPRNDPDEMKTAARRGSVPWADPHTWSQFGSSLVLGPVSHTQIQKHPCPRPQQLWNSQPNSGRLKTEDHGRSTHIQRPAHFPNYLPSPARNLTACPLGWETTGPLKDGFYPSLVQRCLKIFLLVVPWSTFCGGEGTALRPSSQGWKGNERWMGSAGLYLPVNGQGTCADPPARHKQKWDNYLDNTALKKPWKAN